MARYAPSMADVLAADPTLQLDLARVQQQQMASMVGPPVLHHQHHLVMIAPPNHQQQQPQRIPGTRTVNMKWTEEEDILLTRLVARVGTKDWPMIASYLPGRKGKQCRERWYNQLDPSINRDPWSEEEEHILQQAHAQMGNRWADIAKLLPGRTDNQIKNHWNTENRKQSRARYIQQGRAHGLPQHLPAPANRPPSTTTTATNAPPLGLRGLGLSDFLSNNNGQQSQQGGRGGSGAAAAGGSSSAPPSQPMLHQPQPILIATGGPGATYYSVYDGRREYLAQAYPMEYGGPSYHHHMPVVVTSSAATNSKKRKSRPSLDAPSSYSHWQHAVVALPPPVDHHHGGNGEDDEDDEDVVKGQHWGQYGGEGEERDHGVMMRQRTSSMGGGRPTGKRGVAGGEGKSADEALAAVDALLSLQTDKQENGSSASGSSSSNSDSQDDFSGMGTRATGNGSSLNNNNHQDHDEGRNRARQRL